MSLPGFGISVKIFKIYSGCKFLFRSMIYKYFLPFCGLFFYSLQGVLWNTKVLFMFLFFWPCHTACRILVPRPGIEPGPRQLKHRVLSTGPPGKSPKVLIVMESFFFSSITCAFGVIAKLPVPNPRLQTFMLCFLLSFIVLAFTFRSMVHFELIFVYG